VDTSIVLVDCLCDDLLKALRHWEDPQCEAGDAEILAAAQPQPFQSAPAPLRSPAGPLFEVLADAGRGLNEESLYIIDSFPVAACDNYRIRRCRRYRGKVPLSGKLL